MGNLTTLPRVTGRLEEMMLNLLSRTENKPHHISGHAAETRSFPSQFLVAVNESKQE